MHKRLNFLLMDDSNLSLYILSRYLNIHFYIKSPLNVSWKFRGKCTKLKNTRRIWNPIWEREGFFCLSKQIFHFRLEREVSKRFAKSKRIPSYFLLWHKSLNLQTYNISQFLKKKMSKLIKLLSNETWILARISI